MLVKKEYMHQLVAYHCCPIGIVDLKLARNDTAGKLIKNDQFMNLWDLIIQIDRVHDATKPDVRVVGKEARKGLLIDVTGLRNHNIKVK